jgi:predicted Zn-dependent peptidase
LISTRNLKCGAKLVMEKIPTVESVSIGIWVACGSAYESPKYSGISHFVEHMMFKGTENRSALEIVRDVDKIGGQINAMTGKEATCYYIKSTADKFKEAADVLTDMLTSSVFPAREMTKERNVIGEEIKMSLDSPDELSLEKAESLLFRDSCLGNSITGTPTSLSHVSRPVMRKFVSDMYTLDSMVISVAGKFSEIEVCSVFEEKFADMKQTRVAPELRHGTSSPEFTSIKKDIEQTHLCLMTKGVPLSDDRYYPLTILNNALGESMSSRLFQSIREQKGLAYTVYSMIGCYSDDGFLAIYAGVAHDKVHKAVDAVKEELIKLGKEGITAEELESSRAQLRAAYIFAQENSLSRMFKNGKNLLLMGRAYDTETVIEGFDKVTLDEVNEVKDLICDPSTYCGAVVSDRKVDLKGMMKN